MSKASDEERVTFPEVVKALTKVGVERYHTDLVAARKTYYLPSGDFEETQVHEAGAPALEFSADGLEKALRAIQRQEIGYREFCRRIAEAACVGYFVSLAGRRAIYYGRTGDEYVEWFRAPSREPRQFLALNQNHRYHNFCNQNETGKQRWRSEAGKIAQRFRP